jgi:hypothetical protein
MSTGIHTNARIQEKHIVGTVVGVVGLRSDAKQTLYGIWAAHTAQAATCGIAFAGPTQLMQRQPVNAFLGRSKWSWGKGFGGRRLWLRVEGKTLGSGESIAAKLSHS